MKRKKGKPGMLIPTIIMGVIAITLYIIAYSKGTGQHLSGVKTAVTMTIELMPLLIFAFIIAGLIQELLPHELIAKWIGGESGIRGILIGTIAGGISPGGPYVSLPIAAGLLNAGAGIGTMVAYITGWSLWAVARIPMEVGILGWKFTLIRIVSTFIFPPIAGIIAQSIFGKWE